MGQAGEDRHLDENSDDETDEEEDETDEDEDVEGSDEDEDEDDDDDDNQEDDDEDDDEDDEDDEDDTNGNVDETNKFQNEPKTPINGGSNIVEDYGVEGVPGDEDLEKGERSRSAGDDAQKSKKTLGLLCCCVLILAIIGTVLGVTLGKKDDDSTTTSKAVTTAPPVRVPATQVPAPSTPKPSTAAPTAAPLEYSIPASADTYVFLSGGEDGSFGNESSLLVQSNENGASMALMNFDLPFLPPPEVLGFAPRATLVLSLLEQSGRFLEDANATLTSFAPSAVIVTTSLISGFSGDLEAITSNSSSLFDQLNQTMGPSFEIVPGSKEVTVDISSLLTSPHGSESPDIILRRLQRPGSSKILLGLMIDDAQGGGSVRFYSAQSDSPPKIDVDLSGSTGETSGCPICGEGNNVTYPDAELDLPQIGNVTCGELEYIANSGVVSEEQCSLLQPFINGFCCDSGVDESAKIYVCDLCADGGNITNPTTILPITGQVNKTCSEYEGMAMQGLIPAELCAPLQILSDKMCCGIEL